LATGIKITNELKFKKLLWMRCYSKDDVLDKSKSRRGLQQKKELTAPNEPRQANNRFRGCSFTRSLDMACVFWTSSYSDLGGLWDWRAREDEIYFQKKKSGLHVKFLVNMYKVYDWIN
ncbi:S-protein homolog 16-like, partial [Capsella rubella]|uniref:S-protein homolog 16-like n=1 Tax=Capsella rubella TaxID=81985 RepID=UPI000CD4B2F1